MRTRLKDVAESLGLSISTVNAALQNRSDISVATRERVVRKARDLGYRTNWVARSLVKQKTQVIGVVVPDLSRSFFTEVAKGIDMVTSEADYQLLICNTDEDALREDEKVSTLIGKQVDGLIIASTHSPGSKEVWEDLDKTGIPVVHVDRFFPGTHFVGCDDFRIGLLATEHLIAAGYQRIAHIRGPNISTANGRYEGYLEALRRHGKKARRGYVLEAPYHAEIGGSDAVERLLQQETPPDAIFAASDPIAIGALDALHRRGIRLPEDFGLIGVGNMRYSQYLSIPMSTVDQQRREIGKCAAKLLLALIGGGGRTAPQNILLEPQLIPRTSSAR